MKPLILALVVGALLGYFGPRLIAGDPGREVEAARDSIAVLAPLLEAATERAELAEAEALRADTVLVTVTETETVVIERAIVVASEAADSLHARADSTEAALLDVILAAHAEEVAAVWVIADQRLAWGTEWMEAAMAKDSVIALQDAKLAQLEMATTALNRRIAGMQRTQTIERVVSLAGWGLVALDYARN